MSSPLTIEEQVKDCWELKELFELVVAEDEKLLKEHAQGLAARLEVT